MFGSGVCCFFVARGGEAGTGENAQPNKSPGWINQTASSSYGGDIVGGDILINCSCGHDK